MEKIGNYDYLCEKMIIPIASCRYGERQGADQQPGCTGCLAAETWIR